VLNPYAQFLSFPDQTTRLRRDHEKYLTLIDTIAFVHQHQRPVRSAERGAQRIEYIEVHLADIQLANAIAHDVLGRSLDELPPQTRRLLKLVDQYVGAEVARQQIRRNELRFSRRALREAIAWGDTQTKLHLARLVELEYLVAHRTKTGGYEYELVYEVAGGDGVGGGDAVDAGALRFPGLADIEALKRAYDAERSGSNDAWSAPGRGVVGPRSAGGREAPTPANPASTRVAAEDEDDGPETHFCGLNGSATPYPHAAIPLAAAGA
jgi:hypothetical protein